MSIPERIQSELEESVTEEVAKTLVQPGLGDKLPADDFIDDRYQMDSLVGEGGMGTVYKARHLLLDRWVAIKVLSRAACSSPKAVMRFQQEAKAASALSHEHIASVREFGLTKDGLPFLAIDYVDGLDLSKVLKEGPLEPHRAIEIFMQACDAMSYAHKRGILHRDLKPGNILLTAEDKRQDFVKIVDFGIAKILNEYDEEATNLTQTGEIFGTPLYMSPEQCQGLKVDVRTDIYALGCVMYESLAGQPPFTAPNSAALILKHVSHLPQPFSTQDRTDKKLVEALENVVLRCLEKDPDHRYQSMQDLHDALNFARQGGKPTLNISRSAKRRRNLIGFGLACGILMPMLAVGPLVLPYFSMVFWPTPAPWNKTRDAARAESTINSLGPAEATLKRALREAQAGNASDSDRLGIYYDLGNVYLNSQQYALAVEAFRKALPLCDTAHVPLITANTLELIAYSQYCTHWTDDGMEKSEQALRDYNEGLDMANRALKLKEGAVGPDHEYLSCTLVKLARLYQAVGDDKNAETSWHRAIKIAEKSPTIRASAADDLAELGDLLMHQHRRAEADQCFSQAITIAKELYGTDSAKVEKLEKKSRRMF